MAQQESGSNSPFVIHADNQQQTERESASMKQAISSFLAARIELASIEAKEAAEVGIRKALFLLGAAAAALLGWLLLLASLTIVLGAFVDQWFASGVSWLSGYAVMLFIFASLHLLVAVIGLQIFKKKSGVALFELTRQEIQNDKQWLGEN